MKIDGLISALVFVFIGVFIMIGIQGGTSPYVQALQSQPANGVVVSNIRSDIQAYADNNVPAAKKIDGSNTSTDSWQQIDNRSFTQAQEGTSRTSEQAEKSLKTEQNEQAVQQVLAQLKARDMEVRAHEQAHLAAAGSHARGGMSFTYQTGPDGRQYAIGGEVGIDTSAVPGDPEATLQKAMQIQRAALAPAEPSAQDLRVASSAAQMAVEARQQIREQQMAESQAENNSSSAGAKKLSESESQGGLSQQISGNEANANELFSRNIEERNQFAIRLQLNSNPSVNQTERIASAY